MYSIITVIFADPKTLEASLKKLMLSTTAEFTHTLSAPDLNTLSMSDIFLMPPPTDIGMNIFLAVLEIKLLRLLVP